MTDLVRSDAALRSSLLPAPFRQELDGAWSVRLGPVSREAMLDAITRFAF